MRFRISSAVDACYNFRFHRGVNFAVAQTRIVHCPHAWRHVRHRRRVGVRLARPDYSTYKLCALKIVEGATGALSGAVNIIVMKGNFYDYF